MTALSTPTKAELESLVTKAIYASLITARLSPASNPPSVNVTAVAPLRDVQPQSLPQMIANLSEWESRCGEVVSDLEAEIARVKSDAAKRAARAQAHNEALEEAVKRKQSTGKKGGRRGGRLGAGVGGVSGMRMTLLRMMGTLIPMTGVIIAHAWILMRRPVLVREIVGSQRGCWGASLEVWMC